MPRGAATGTLGDMRVRSLVAALTSLGASAPSLAAFREGALDAIARVVRADAMLLHALSPRVPLETAALRGIDPARLRATMQHWDRWAVELGRFRDVALSQGGVATDREALPSRGTARKTFERALSLGTSRRVRAAAIVHLVVRERIVAVLLLLRHRDEPFADDDVAMLRAIAPALAVADALQQRLDDAVRAQQPVRLVCRDDRLTARQREIVEHVALGHTNAQIGGALGVSPNTIRNLLARVFERLGASNRADVVRLAVLRPDL